MAVNGRVYAVEVVGDTVFVGGEFDTATGPGGAPEEVERLNLAAFDVNTGAVVEDWRADADAPVRALDARKGFLYVGGSFGEVGGKPRSRLAKVNVDTAAVNGTFAPRLDRGVRAVEVRGTRGLRRRVVHPGRPSRPPTRGQAGHGRGRVDRGFVANTSDPVWALVGNPASRTLYVAGRFNAVNGARRLGVAAVHSGSGRTRSVVFTDAARQTLGLAVNDSGSRLFTAGGTRENAVAAWRTTTGARVWRDRAMGDIQAIDFLDGTVYFGFHQGFAGDRCVRSSPPVLGPETWTRTSAPPSTGSSGCWPSTPSPPRTPGTPRSSWVDGSRRSRECPPRGSRASCPPQAGPTRRRASPPSRGPPSRLALLRQVHQGEHVLGGAPDRPGVPARGIVDAAQLALARHVQADQGVHHGLADPYDRRRGRQDLEGGGAQREGDPPRRGRGAATSGVDHPVAQLDLGGGAREVEVRWATDGLRVGHRHGGAVGTGRRSTIRAEGPAPPGRAGGAESGSTETGVGAMIRSTTWRSPRWSGRTLSWIPGRVRPGPSGLLPGRGPPAPPRTATGFAAPGGSARSSPPATPLRRPPRPHPSAPP